ASIIPPMPRNGAIHSSQRGSTPCWRCCSGAWKRRASAKLSPRAIAAVTCAAQIPLHDPHSCLQRGCAPQAACCLISIKSGTSPANWIVAEESVRLAVFTDIHANRQAFSACLDFARARGAERIICLGDYVGYGADPEWTVETVMGLVDSGAMAVRGNHDNAISSTESMNAQAQAAIEWTRGRLSAAQR